MENLGRVTAESVTKEFMRKNQELIKMVDEKLYKDIKSYKIPEIFNDLFCVGNYPASVKEDRTIAFTEVGNYVLSKMDEIVYRELGFKKDKITRVDVTNKITELVDLANSIKPLLGYDALVQDVVDDPVYSWKLIVLDGVDYVSKTHGLQLEVIYPQLSKLGKRRHFYKDIAVLPKVRKLLFKDQFQQEHLSSVLEYMYVIRTILKTAYLNYGVTVNLTDVYLRLLIKEVYGLKHQKVWNKFVEEYRLRNIQTS